MRVTARRNYQFDFLRILFAILVLLAHAPELTDGNPSRELFHRATRSNMTFGAAGVDGFFLLSGFLIVQSWQSDPRLLDFLQKRILRIVPGYLVAALLSTFAIGWLAPGVPAFFSHLGWLFGRSVLLLGEPDTPSVFPGTRYPSVNGSLWTIPYEFRCYLLVAMLGVLGVFRRSAVWLSLTVIFFLIFSSAALQQRVSFNAHPLLLGESERVYRLTCGFLIGGCFYLFRDRIKYQPGIALIASVILLGVGAVVPGHLESALMVCGGYLLFYFSHASLPALAFMQRVPDISYGVYLYGWPVESLWIWYRHGSPWVTFLVSTLTCSVLGWLSWHCVERPLLRLKRRPSAPLPPS